MLGTVTVISESETTVALVPALAAEELAVGTKVTPEKMRLGVVNPEPSMVMVFPPSNGPLSGLTELTVGSPHDDGFELALAPSAPSVPVAPFVPAPADDPSSDPAVPAVPPVPP